jgi:hypothetical protein
MAVTMVVGEYEYAMVAAQGDPDIEQFVGYREGMEFDANGKCINAGHFVPGSNNGWIMGCTYAGVQIYVRDARSR